MCDIEIEKFPTSKRRFALNLVAGQRTLKAVVQARVKQLGLCEDDPLFIFDNPCAKMFSDGDTSDEDDGIPRRESVASQSSIEERKDMVREFLILSDECLMIDLSAYQKVDSAILREKDPVYQSKKARLEYLAMHFFFFYQWKEERQMRLTATDFELKSAVDDVLYRILSCYM